jgi:hypothetical protein
MLNRLAVRKAATLLLGPSGPTQGLLDAILPPRCENLEPELLRLGRTTFFYRDNVHKVNRVL